MRRNGGIGIILVAVLAATVGCSPVGVPQSGPLAVYPKPDAGMDALLTGTLQLLDECVLVQSDDHQNAVPVFPSGDATWDDAAATLTWKGQPSRVGEPISLGGGFGSTSGVENGYIPEACERYDTFFVSPY